MSELSAIEEAHARARVYSILAKLLTVGLDADALAQLRALDDWLLPGAPLGGAVLDLDELAAQHHACFHLEVFPYAGVFLDPGAVAGACSDMVLDRFAQAGFRPRLDQLTADHLGVMLGFLGFVCAATSEALEDRQSPFVARLERVGAEFLDACILSWLPTLVAASDELPRGMWPNVLREALEFAAAHRISLRERVPGSQPPELPEPRHDLLEDPNTGLRRIAEHLLTPAASGVLLTRADLERLGREQSLGRGFGSRLTMLDNLLRSAVDYGRFGDLLADLDRLLAKRDHTFMTLGTELELDAAIAPWRRALSHTRELLTIVAAARR